MAQISKIERILNLVSFLLKERRPVPWRAISGQVVGYDDDGDPKSLERRFERDKAALKELGIPVRFYPPGSHEQEGYLISRDHCFLDPLELLPQEASLLKLVSELSMRKGERSLDLVSALQKLRFDESPQDLRADENADDAWHQSLLRLDKVAALRGRKDLDRVTEAILTNRPIKFTYYAISSGVTKQRFVDPYGLGFFQGSWYLVGRDHSRDAARQFKLQRIKGRIEFTGDKGSFQVPEGFDVSEHVGRAPWAMESKGQPPREVTVLVDRDIAWFSEGPFASKESTEREDGSAVVRFDVRDSNAFLRWLLTHARHVRVIEPAALKAEFAAALDTIASRHATPPPQTKKSQP